MSRSTFLTTSSSFDANETPSLPTSINMNTDHTHALRFHHRLMPTISTSSRSNELSPIVVVQSSTMTKDSTTTTTTTNSTQHKSVVRLNPTVKRNLRGKRRSTGIRPDEVLLATAAAASEIPFNEDDTEEDNTNTCDQFITITSAEPSEAFDHNRISPPQPVFKVSRVQPTFDENSHRSFEKLTINRSEPFIMTSSSSSSSSNMFPTPSTKTFRPEQFILRRQPSDEDPTTVKCRQYEERIRMLESLVHDKDSIIHDLQRKLEKTTRDLNDAEQQIYVLQRDKSTLIKTFTTLQETKPSSGDVSMRTGFIQRN